MSKRLTRRSFLETSSKAAAIGLTLQSMSCHARAADANAKFNVGIVGCGGMGRYKLGNFMESGQCNIVAVCDVDDSQAKGAAADVNKKLGTNPKQIKNYHELLDMKDIDLVIVATPDHWHAPVMMLACQAGKHVYCEKPCSHNVREARAMVDAAAKYKRIVQVGTHQRSMPHLQQARELVRGGKLGPICMTQTFTTGNESPDGMGQPVEEPVPDGVNYDMWLGPAPLHAFNRHRFHNTWRWFFDYAAGMVGDWNVHLQDIIMWTMGAQYPISVSTVGGKLVLTDDRDTPDTMQAVYEFGPSESAAKGFMQTYTMRKASGKPWDAGGYGMDFHGGNGMLHLTRDWVKLDPDKVDWRKADSPPRTDKKDEHFPGADQKAHLEHVKNFLDCIRNGGKPIASIDQHYYTVVACHLANVSLRCGRRIFWDHQKELCFKDRELTLEDVDANKYLTREYRKGYELPQV